MPKRVPPLTDIQVSKAKPRERDYKLTDGGGLYLLVTTAGGKLWRLKYRFADKEAEKELRANTFKKLALEWHERQVDHLAERTRKMIMRRLRRDVFPVIGDTPLTDLSSRLILEKVLRPIEDRTAIDLSHRIRSVLSQILRYGVACGLCDRDLTADLRGALKPIPRKHHAALDAGGTTDPNKVGALLRAIDGFEGSVVVKCALRLHPLVATRPGKLRHAEWSEIDFDTATWSIPAGRMKMKTRTLCRSRRRRWLSCMNCIKSPAREPIFFHRSGPRPNRSATTP